MEMIKDVWEKIVTSFFFFHNGFKNVFSHISIKTWDRLTKDLWTSQDLFCELVDFFFFVNLKQT